VGSPRSSYKDNASYDRYYLALLNELVTHYGELTEFWLDGAASAGHVYDFDHYVDNLRSINRILMVFADAALLKMATFGGWQTKQGTRRKTIGTYWIFTGTSATVPQKADTPAAQGGIGFWHPNDEQSLSPWTSFWDTYHKTVGSRSAT